ncbi:MAG: gamma-glutamyl-gamma-aminobutyrate hydrolase family protein [Xanthomonadaceae bacterium]|nr:gamma-glutamyl-gamma-aminobutyrate hydrolase family protein [Xanthomonadaceae bacterium]
MARVLVLQHVAAEPLGVLDPMLRSRGHRIRYVNFARDPDAEPQLKRYQALIVLGGPMQVSDTRRYRHLVIEQRLLEKALHDKVPTLGICLGGQLLANVLGGRVGPCQQPEIGWYELRPSAANRDDRVLQTLVRPQPIFQWHHWGFECPADAVCVAESLESGCQAFRAEASAWAFQFHLELDHRLIRRWLSLPFYREDLARSGLPATPESIGLETHEHLPQSLELAERVFGAWLDLLGTPEQRLVLPSRY